MFRSRMRSTQTFASVLLVIHFCIVHHLRRKRNLVCKCLVRVRSSAHAINDFQPTTPLPSYNVNSEPCASTQYHATDIYSIFVSPLSTFLTSPPKRLKIFFNQLKRHQHVFNAVLVGKVGKQKQDIFVLHEIRWRGQGLSLLFVESPGYRQAGTGQAAGRT